MLLGSLAVVEGNEGAFETEYLRVVFLRAVDRSVLKRDDVDLKSFRIKLESLLRRGTLEDIC